jgi:glycogen debranching enzyme
MYESGLDNSPMYDDVPFNERANTFELADVALNSYYAMDCEALAAMADCLDRPRDAAGYRRQYEAIKRRINDVLWDEEHGLYANRHWDGRFSNRWSPTSFFPLIAGIADAEKAERLVREHLLNEAEFWGQYVIPAISRSDPAFGDNDYWRGRIWGPFNFLVAEGLRRYRFDDAAAELSRRGLEMFVHNWRKDGGIYENYNATTGEGGDVWNAARLYHWGGLMALIAIQELIDVEPAGWLRFGSLKFPDAAVRNVRIAGDTYDVELAEGVTVRRNGEPFLASTTRTIVRVSLCVRHEDGIHISTASPGGLTLWGSALAAHGRPNACVNGRLTLQPKGDASTEEYSWHDVPALGSPT